MSLSVSSYLSKLLPTNQQGTGLAPTNESVESESIEQRITQAIKRGVEDGFNQDFEINKNGLITEKGQTPSGLSTLISAEKISTYSDRLHQCVFQIFQLLPLYNAYNLRTLPVTTLALVDCLQQDAIRVIFKRDLKNLGVGFQKVVSRRRVLFVTALIVAEVATYAMSTNPYFLFAAKVLPAAVNVIPEKYLEPLSFKLRLDRCVTLCESAEKWGDKALTHLANRITTYFFGWYIERLPDVLAYHASRSEFVQNRLTEFNDQLTLELSVQRIVHRLFWHCVVLPAVQTASKKSAQTTIYSAEWIRDAITIRVKEIVVANIFWTCIIPLVTHQAVAASWVPAIAGKDYIDTALIYWTATQIFAEKSDPQDSAFLSIRTLSTAIYLYSGSLFWAVTLKGASHTALSICHHIKSYNSRIHWIIHHKHNEVEE